VSDRRDDDDEVDEVGVEDDEVEEVECVEEESVSTEGWEAGKNVREEDEAAVTAAALVNVSSAESADCRECVIW